MNRTRTNDFRQEDITHQESIDKIYIIKKNQDSKGANENDNKDGNGNDSKRGSEHDRKRSNENDNKVGKCKR